MRDTPYKDGGIQPEYVGEDKPDGIFAQQGIGYGVRYLGDDALRERYRITIHDGFVYDARGHLFDTQAGISAFPGIHGRAIFAMDQNGNLYASIFQRTGYFHHSSFFAGENVAAAGELVVRRGKIEMVTDHSGHYRPGRSRTQQVLDQLASQGIDIDPNHVDYWAPEGS